MPAVFNPLSLFVFEQHQQMKIGPPTFGLTTLNYSNQSANNADGKKWLSIKYLQGVDQKERKFFENNPKSGVFKNLNFSFYFYLKNVLCFVEWNKAIMFSSQHRHK